MPEAINPVVATPGGNPAETAKAPAEEPVKWTVNEEPEGVEKIPTTGAKDFPSLGNIIDKVTKGAKDEAKAKKEPEAKVATDKPQEDPQAPRQKERLKVKLADDKVEEYELDGEQMKRFAQKGIYYEKKQALLNTQQKEVQASVKEVEAMRHQLNQALEGLKDPETAFAILEELHGPEKARQITEGYLRPKVELELLKESDPVAYEKMTLQQKLEATQAELQQLKQGREQEQIDVEAKRYEQEYQNIILEALKEEGVPKTTYAAHDMARLMQVGLEKNVEYTPKQLAQMVKKDNIGRVGALIGHHVQQIEEAKKAGDSATVIAAGEQLVDMLGEPVMYAIAKYHLAKRLQPNQPQQPAQVLDTAKVTQMKPKKAYMSEDEYRETRGKIARGEMEPPPGW